MLLGIHFTKHYRFEREFYRAFCSVDRYVIFQIALAKFSKNVLSFILCQEIVLLDLQFACIGRLHVHVALLEAKIE